MKCILEVKKYISRIQRAVSLRHCYYYLFSKGLIKPTDRDYQNLSQWLEWAKRNQYIPWHWITDNSRASWMRSLSGDIIGFVNQEVDKRYTRDYWKAQDYLILLLCEKEALASLIISPFVTDYGIPLFVTRGYLSYGSLYQDIVKFLQRYQNSDLKTVIFVLTDFDVHGLLIYEDIEAKFAYAKSQWGIQTHLIKRIALTSRQISQLQLSKFKYPIFKQEQNKYKKILKQYGWNNFQKASKNESESKKCRRLTQAKRFIQNHGWGGIELDVLTPNDLDKIIRNEMNPYYNFKTQDLEKQKEKLEKESLYPDYLLTQREIDNAKNLKDINNLEAKLAQEKKNIGIP